MEGTLFSTVYRGLPFIGGQPVPPHDAVAALRGFVVLAIPQPAFGQSGRRNPLRGKCRRCVPGFVVGAGNP